MLFGLGFETGVWLAEMSPATDPAMWQTRQLLSFAWAPPVCRTRPAGAGLTKLTLSWQALQARRVGWFFQLSASGTGLDAVLRWHFTQLRTSCGNVTSYGLV